MNTKEIWISIIIPILIGPLFLYLKTLYDNFVGKKKEHQIMVYNNSKERLGKLLNNFYWPLYIKLLCITQLNFYVPVKNSFEYISDSGSSSSTNSLLDDDKRNSDVRINISDRDDIILDTETLRLMKENLDALHEDARKIIEENLYFILGTNEIIDELILFIKYCRIRIIINDGSINKKYNIEYFGIKNNLSNLVKLIEIETYRKQEELNKLIENGPFN